MSNNKGYKKLIIANVVTLAVLVGGGAAGFYYYNQAENYLKTDNAKVDGQVVTIASPVAGKVREWNAGLGKTYNQNDTLGKVSFVADVATGKEATADVKIPVDATVIKQSVVKNGMVGAGTVLAYAYDFDELYVTANIKETVIDEVEIGQEVDLELDAFPGTTLKGTVDYIGQATANSFSIMPSSNTTGNYTKVTQVIPVKIKIEDAKGVHMVPGMNVSVKIHK